jgi:hypothetical protein
MAARRQSWAVARIVGSLALAIIAFLVVGGLAEQSALAAGMSGSGTLGTFMKYGMLAFIATFACVMVLTELLVRYAQDDGDAQTPTRGGGPTDDG